MNCVTREERGQRQGKCRVWEGRCEESQGRGKCGQERNVG